MFDTHKFKVFFVLFDTKITITQFPISLVISKQTNVVNRKTKLTKVSLIRILIKTTRFLDCLGTLVIKSKGKEKIDIRKTQPALKNAPADVWNAVYPTIIDDSRLFL